MWSLTTFASDPTDLESIKKMEEENKKEREEFITLYNKIISGELQPQENKNYHLFCSKLGYGSNQVWKWKL